jgi:hypothetical protein
MNLRQWYLGAGTAAMAALLPLSAQAVSLPNLLNGGGPLDIAANPGDLMEGKFTGVTTETAAIALTNTTGTSCTVAGCAETTWGIGFIQTVSDVTQANQQTWQNGDPVIPPSAQTSIAFVIYGIADESVTTIDNGNGTVTQTVKNTGATTSEFGATDGVIHIDFYYMPRSEQPCFTLGCESATTTEITASDRTANDVDGTANVTGITDTGVLFASFELQKGVDPDPTVTLSQTVTIDLATGKTTGSGNQANFYATCVAGPGCDQFQDVPESVFGATSQFPTDITNIFGNIGVSSSAGASVFTGVPGTCNADPFLPDGETPNPLFATSCPNTAGWTFDTNDPVRFTAAIPEPASLAVLGSALAFFGVAVRRRRRGTSA